jgi:hypothetical protein
VLLGDHRNIDNSCLEQFINTVPAGNRHHYSSAIRVDAISNVPVVIKKPTLVEVRPFNFGFTIKSFFQSSCI